MLVLSAAQLLQALKLAWQNKDFRRDEEREYQRVIRFKNSYPEKHEQNRCAMIAVSKDHHEYITSIQTISDRKFAHHMTLTACKDKPNVGEYQEDSNTWNCDEGGFEVCGLDKETGEEYSRRVYTWSLDAKGIDFPDGVGYRVGGDTNLYYLVVQVHYANELAEGEKDSLSSYVLKMTDQELPYQVGVYTLGDDGYIPPGIKNFPFEAGCHFHLPYEIVPIAYRTHAHLIIPVISGYAVIDGEWIELGRMSPKQPEQFYPVTNEDVIVKRGDILASRCTCDSSNRTTTLWTGYKHDDEMCVFYLMFYTDYKKTLEDFYCYKDGNKFSWRRNLKIRTDPPENASNLDGVDLPVPSMEFEKTKRR